MSDPIDLADGVPRVDGGLEYEIPETRLLHEYSVFLIQQQLEAIVEQTELPQSFDIKHVTSTSNGSIANKLGFLQHIPALREQLFPTHEVCDYSVSYDQYIYMVAPWVNMIHAWSSVLNAMNSVAAIQRQEMPTPESRDEVLVALSHFLYRATTRFHGETMYRGDQHFTQFRAFPETIMRESGTKGVNPNRHICFAELMYILGVIRRVYAKGVNSEE